MRVASARKFAALDPSLALSDANSSRPTAYVDDIRQSDHGPGRALGGGAEEKAVGTPRTREKIPGSLSVIQSHPHMNAIRARWWKHRDEPRLTFSKRHQDARRAWVSDSGPRLHTTTKAKTNILFQRCHCIAVVSRTKRPVRSSSRIAS